VKLLATVSGDILNEKDDNGNSPVYSALCHGHLEVAHYLLDLGAGETKVTDLAELPLVLPLKLGIRKSSTL
jgi:ankyrin repeat protein